jgi:trk system potassium uptake protein TrkH
MRVARVKPTSEHLDALRPRRRPLPPGLLLVLGFVVLIAVGTLVLVLPVSSQDRSWTPLLDALYTATSAVCQTGLTVVVTADHWSALGQITLLVLVQVGGFGIMTGSTLLLLLLGGRQRVGLSGRLALQQSTGELRLGGVLSVVRRVALFTFVVEAVGALVLAVAFLVSGHATSLVQGAWWGLFHAVSAFNNAGFDLVGPSGLASLRGDWLVLAPLGVLILLGTIGFAIVADVATHRRWRQLSVESKMVLLSTAAIIGIGSLVMMGLEWDSPRTLGALPLEQRPPTALFETISLRSAGFSTLPVAALSAATMFVLVTVMFIGGAPGSTAGGIKVTTLSLLIAGVVATARGDSSPRAFGRRFSTELMYRAMSVALLSLAFLSVTALLLGLFSPEPFMAVLFEAASALATAGGTAGVTETADTAGRLVLVVAMFVGRLGPLTLVLVLAARSRPAPYRHALEAIRIG